MAPGAVGGVRPALGREAAEVKGDVVGSLIAVILALLVFLVGYVTGCDRGERWGIAIRDEFLKQRNIVENMPNRDDVIWVMRPGDRVATCFRDDEAGATQAAIYLLSGRGR